MLTKESLFIIKTTLNIARIYYYNENHATNCSFNAQNIR